MLHCFSQVSVQIEAANVQRQQRKPKQIDKNLCTFILFFSIPRAYYNAHFICLIRDTKFFYTRTSNANSAQNIPAFTVGLPRFFSVVYY